VLAWNASDLLCLGPDCEVDRDRDVCCKEKAICAEEYSCPHGFVSKPPPAWCEDVACDFERDLHVCCFPAMPCTNLTCPENYVQRPNQYCSKAVHEPLACTLTVDLDICCERGMALKWYRFHPITLRHYRSYQVQLAEFDLYFYGEKVQGSVLEQGGVAFSVDGNYPGGERPSMAIDENLETKWLDADPEPKWKEDKVYAFKALTVELPRARPIDSYSYATANDIADRDPISWTLEGSADYEKWVLLAEVTHAQQLIPTERQIQTPVFSILVPCFSPRPAQIENSNDTLPCVQGDLFASGEICTPSCADGYIPDVEQLNCTNGAFEPKLFTCQRGP